MLTTTLEGTLKFWNKDKGFGFVVTSQGDAFVHVSATLDHLNDMQKEGAVITIEAGNKFVKDKFQLTATAVVKVVLPEVRVVWACVRTFNEERMSATVNLGETDLLEQTAFVPRRVIEQSGVIPGVGMPMRAQIKSTKVGWDVESFATGPAILAQYKQYLDEMIELARQVEANAAVDVAVAEPKPADKPKLKRKPKSAQPQTLEEAVAACAVGAPATAMAEALAGAVMH
jgi:cold shock CspA family protein